MALSMYIKNLNVNRPQHTPQADQSHYIQHVNGTYEESDAIDIKASGAHMDTI